MTKTILINKENKIKNNYFKNVEFINTKDVENKDIQVEEETYLHFLELKKFLETKNIFIGIDSAYRSLEKQKEIYEKIRNEHGTEYANKIVAPIGYSEHHTGLAIDISIEKNNELLNSNNIIEVEEKIYLEIHKHLSDFGFILRYPKDKESITGYPYEPWHIRYVGKFVAKIIYEKNYTLEEYLTDYSGIIIVNKNKGVTSFDIVNDIKHLFGIKRVGHTGTLDPIAQGVLVITIGKATKIVELLTATYKEYIATVKLGIKTDTLDITGNIIETKKIPTNIDLKKILQSFKKTYMQEVPIFSAVKVNGKKLYEYARNNLNIVLPKKKVTIKEIELLSTTNDTFTFKALVSKGCYIRSLINDIATSMNTCATMEDLIRTKQGKISIKDAKTIDEIKNNNFKLYDIQDVLEIVSIEVDEELEKEIRVGKKLMNTWNIKEKVLFKNKNNQILGIYENKNNNLVVWKNFV